MSHLLPVTTDVNPSDVKLPHVSYGQCVSVDLAKWTPTDFLPWHTTGKMGNAGWLIANWATPVTVLTHVYNSVQQFGEHTYNQNIAHLLTTTLHPLTVWHLYNIAEFHREKESIVWNVVLYPWPDLHRPCGLHDIHLPEKCVPFSVLFTEGTHSCV